MSLQLRSEKSIKEILKAINYWGGWAWIAGLIFISGLLLANFWYVEGKYGKLDSPGSFGDSFGGVGALFSGIALIGVFFTLREQQRQIQEQRSFLARSEMNETFFELIKIFEKVQSKISSGIDSNTNMPTTNELFGALNIASSESTEEVFHTFELKYKSVLDPYFRTLKYILKFLKGNQLENDETRLYSNLLRTQISQEEAGLIYLNLQYREAISKREIESRDRFIYLVHYFQLLIDIKEWDAINEPLRSEIDEFIKSER